MTECSSLCEHHYHTADSLPSDTRGESPSLGVGLILRNIHSNVYDKIDQNACIRECNTRACFCFIFMCTYFRFAGKRRHFKHTRPRSHLVSGRIQGGAPAHNIEVWRWWFAVPQYLEYFEAGTFIYIHCTGILSYGYCVWVWFTHALWRGRSHRVLAMHTNTHTHEIKVQSLAVSRTMPLAYDDNDDDDEWAQQGWIWIGSANVQQPTDHNT